MAVYGYIRVSRETQAESGLGLAAQRQRVDDYCARELNCTPEVVSDPGISASQRAFLARAGGSALDARLARGDHIVIAKLDRAFRSLKDCATMLERWRSRGVIVHILDIAVATHTPIGQLLVGIMASVAQWESARIGERIREAKAILRAQGRATNGVVPHGMRRYGQYLRPDHEARGQVASVLPLRHRGWSWREIADHLNGAGYQHRGKPWTAKTAWAAGSRALQEGWAGETAALPTARPVRAGYRHATGDVKRAARLKVSPERRQEIARQGAAAARRAKQR